MLEGYKVPGVLSGFGPFCHDIRDPLKDFHESSLSLNLIVDCSRVIELLDNTVEIYGGDPGIWEDKEQECDCIQAIKDLTYLAGQGSTCAHDAVYRACEHYFAVVRTVAVSRRQRGSSRL